MLCCRPAIVAPHKAIDRWSRRNPRIAGRTPWRLVAAELLGLCAIYPFAAAAGATVFKCPGQPAFYTSDARLASTRGCESLDRRAIFTAPAAPAVSSAAHAVGSRAPAAKPALVAMVAPASRPSVVPREVQQVRDDDRKRILQTELAREREALQSLNETLTKARAQESGADVERIGQAIRRKEADVEAINRELAMAPR